MSLSPALPIQNIYALLATATTPPQSRAVESISAASMAYAKEQNDYELYMNSWRVYIEARRKTTALILQDLDHNVNVTYEQYGFKPMQWSRRLRELEVPAEKLDGYFDKLVSSGWQPSIAGLLRESTGEDLDRYARAVAELKRGANTLLDSFADRLTPELKRICESVRRYE